MSLSTWEAFLGNQVCMSYSCGMWVKHTTQETHGVDVWLTFMSWDPSATGVRIVPLLLILKKM